MANMRFVTSLGEQLDFIAASCEAYDVGKESEAKRIAQALRVLFHDKSGSPSLAVHLGMKNWEILSSPPRVLAEYSNFVAIKIELTSATPVRAIPILGNQFEITPLADWWDRVTAYSFDQRQYTRRNLILAAANKDGGSHVDAKLAPFYEDLASGIRSLGIDGKNLEYSGAAPFDQNQVQYPQNLHLAIIRQFGHEVCATAHHYRWLQTLSS